MSKYFWLYGDGKGQMENTDLQYNICSDFLK